MSYMRYHGFMSKRNESDHKDKGKKFQINQTQKYQSFLFRGYIRCVDEDSWSFISIRVYIQAFYLTGLHIQMVFII